MNAIVNGRILLPDCVREGDALLFDEQIIGIVRPEAIPEGADIIDAKGLYVSPGLVDVHIHGYAGEDASDGSEEGIRNIARGILKNGVTSFLPTTMTVAKETLCAVFSMLRDLRKESRSKGWNGAEILGVHAEGPFINPTRKGAQSGEYILPPDAGFLLAYADIIRLVTLAPEMPGAMACIERVARETDMLLSMGHTDADFETAVEAIRRGVRHATHTFNAMTPIVHRAPGVTGAALAEDITAELIADCFHIHPGLFPLIAKAKGDRLCLITDCTRAGGLSDGEYSLGGQPIYVKGVECRLLDGTIAGSVLKLDRAVDNYRRHARVPLHEAVAAASANPARAIFASNKGSLEPGKDADILLADEGFHVQAVYLRGKRMEI